MRLLRLGRIIKLLKSEDAKIITNMLTYITAFLLELHWITCAWLIIIFNQYSPNVFMGFN